MRRIPRTIILSLTLVIGLAIPVFAGLVTAPPRPAENQLSTRQGALSSVHLTSTAAPQPIRLLGIALRPPVLPGDNAVKLILRLTQPAPAGGFRVRLKSSDPQLIAMPHAITVPAGTTGIGLTLRTDPHARGTVTLSAFEQNSLAPLAVHSVTVYAVKVNLLPVAKGARK